MLNSILYAVLIILFIGFAVLVYLVFTLRKKIGEPKDDSSMKVMMEWMKDIKEGTERTRQTMDDRIHETNKAINERLDKAAQVIGSLSKELGQMSQIGPDIRRLSETLASPKMRGNFGEEILENMLGEVLPKSGYKIQYKFKNGETVDAVVMVGKTILSIDSKFSMENFRLFKESKDDETAEDLKKAFLRDVKKRVDEICKKYILPQEGTFDFALMFVPSEGVYQEILPAMEIMEYCRTKKVLPVSPNSLFVYLQNIIVSMRGQQINEAAKEIMKMVSGIKTESEKFGKNLDVLSTHIKNAGNTMGTVSNDFVKLKMSIHNAATLELKAEEKVLETQKLLD